MHSQPEGTTRISDSQHSFDADLFRLIKCIVRFSCIQENPASEQICEIYTSKNKSLHNK